MYFNTNSYVFRSIVGAGTWTIIAVFLAPGASPEIITALICGSIGVYSACAWLVLSRRERPNIESGSKDAARKHH